MKRLFILTTIIVSFLLISSFADESGNTVVGKIFKNDTTPAYNASVILHSTAMRTTYGCNCSSVAIDYSSDTGDYSSSVDNLVADEDCTIINQGDPCPSYILPSIDYLWIEVDGSTVIDNATKLPDPQENTSSPKTRTWSSYTKIGTVYYGVNATFPTKDTEAPIVTLVSPSNNSLLNYPSITFYFDVDDDSEIQSCSLIINNAVNKTKTGISKTSTNSITSTISAGEYNWSINCTDFGGNVGQSYIYNLTVADVNAPYFSPEPTNQFVEYGSSLSYDINAHDDFAIDKYVINDTIRFDVNQNGLITNKISLSVGIYWLNISVNDTSGNMNSTTISITVQDTTPPSWVQTPTDKTIENGTSFYYDVNATDLSGVSAYFINDTTNFAIDKTTGVITNATYLDLGTYYLRISVNDTYNNVRYADISITVTADRAAPVISNINVTTTNSSAKINWTTNIPANSTVRYGPSELLENQKTDTDYSTIHLIDLTNLNNFTIYYYNITSCNIFNNCTTVGLFVFVTQQNIPPAQVIRETSTRTVTEIIPGAPVIMPCSENWQCTEWSICSDSGTQTRTCYDAANCGTFLFKPKEVQPCVYKPPFKVPEFRAPKLEVPKLPPNLGAWIVAIFVLIGASISTVAFILSKRKKKDEKKVEQIITKAISTVEPQLKTRMQKSEPKPELPKITENKSKEAEQKLNMLKNYINDSLEKGYDEAYIKKKLQEKGWPESIINQLLEISGKKTELSSDEINKRLSEIEEELRHDVIPD